MSYKTKWAPQPPPEPVITGSLEPQPKKRGRKRTKKDTLLKTQKQQLLNI